MSTNWVLVELFLLLHPSRSVSELWTNGFCSRDRGGPVNRCFKMLSCDSPFKILHSVFGSNLLNCWKHNSSCFQCFEKASSWQSIFRWAFHHGHWNSSSMRQRSFCMKIPNANCRLLLPCLSNKVILFSRWTYRDFNDDLQPGSGLVSLVYFFTSHGMA